MAGRENVSVKNLKGKSDFLVFCHVHVKRHVLNLPYPSFVSDEISLISRISHLGEGYSLMVHWTGCGQWPLFIPQSVFNYVSLS